MLEKKKWEGTEGRVGLGAVDRRKKGRGCWQSAAPK